MQGYRCSVIGAGLYKLFSYGAEDIHDCCAGDGDKFTIEVGDLVLESLECLIEVGGLDEQGGVLTGFLAVLFDRDEFNLSLVPLIAGRVVEDVEELHFPATRYLTITGDERFDFVHEASFNLGAIKTLNDIGFFDFGGIILASLALVSDF